MCASVSGAYPSQVSLQLLHRASYAFSSFTGSGSSLGSTFVLQLELAKQVAVLSSTLLNDLLSGLCSEKEHNLARVMWVLLKQHHVQASATHVVNNLREHKKGGWCVNQACATAAGV